MRLNKHSFESVHTDFGNAALLPFNHQRVEMGNDVKPAQGRELQYKTFFSSYMDLLPFPSMVFLDII